jgi:hypothetical protein
VHCGNQNKMDDAKTYDIRKHIPWGYYINPEGLYKVELCRLPLRHRLFLSCDCHGVTDRTCKQKSWLKCARFLYKTRWSPVYVPEIETVRHVKNNACAVEIKIKWMMQKHMTYENTYREENYVVCLSDTGSSCHVTVMGSLIVLVNKRADWNVPVSYIKCMSPCSACGFSTKKASKVNTLLKVVIFKHYSKLDRISF